MPEGYARVTDLGDGESRVEVGVAGGAGARGAVAAQVGLAAGVGAGYGLMLASVLQE